ncbi:hypothetical protein DRO91_05490 [Candidatus Heimdallarchaeota archaeon]|nr:MAG: hypothetical protein DRO91_05490 [Candidatus Heimdallarchaeota archaeon]
MSVTEKLYESFGELPSRRGRGGFYTFIPSRYIFDRLNEVFGVQWSSEAITHEVVGDNVIVRVRVTVRDPETKEYFYQEGFGGAPLNQNEAGDPYKSAYTKALKDACKHWGLGLHKEDAESGGTRPTTPVQPPTTPSPAPTAPTAPASEPLPASMLPPGQVQRQQMPPQPAAPTADLPPNVPRVVEESIPVQQVPTQEPPVQAPPQPSQQSIPTPPTPQAPTSVPQTETPVAPAAAVEPPAPQTPTVPETPVPAQPAAPQAPSRPADVPLSPIERVKRAKQNAQEESAIPAVPTPNSAVQSPPANPAPENTSGEAMITSVQKVAIEGLIDMKGLNYDEIAAQALGITSGSVPPVETLSHTQAISVIQYINNKYK